MSVLLLPVAAPVLPHLTSLCSLLQTKIHERDSWVGLKAGKSYYFHRNASALIAFHLPEGYTSASPLALVATHVDSCALKVCLREPLSRGLSHADLPHLSPQDPTCL